VGVPGGILWVQVTNIVPYDKPMSSFLPLLRGFGSMASETCASVLWLLMSACASSLIHVSSIFGVILTGNRPSSLGSCLFFGE